MINVLRVTTPFGIITKHEGSIVQHDVCTVYTTMHLNISALSRFGPSRHRPPCMSRVPSSAACSRADFTGSLVRAPPGGDLCSRHLPAVFTVFLPLLTAAQVLHWRACDVRGTGMSRASQHRHNSAHQSPSRDCSPSDLHLRRRPLSSLGAPPAHRGGFLFRRSGAGSRALRPKWVRWNLADQWQSRYRPNCPWAGQWHPPVYPSGHFQRVREGP